jgi:MFS family permease
VYEFQNPAAREVVAQVLDTHPEGHSLLAEAGHRRILAEQSARDATDAFTMNKAARLGYEVLRHRLDPRNGRTVHVGVASLALAVVLLALLELDRIEFAGVLSGWMTVAAAATATAAWAGCAWLAALALREERPGRLTSIAAGAVLAGLLLAALHSVGSAAIRWPGWDPASVSLFLVLVILALVTIATEIIRRTEPPALLSARRRWHRAWKDYQAATRVQRSDAQAAAVAAQEWCSLVDTYATTYAVSGTVAGPTSAGNGHVPPDPWSGTPPM